MIFFNVKNDSLFSWSYGDGISGAKSMIAACVKRWRDRGANASQIEVRGSMEFSGTFCDFIHGLPVIYVFPQNYTGIEEVTVDYCLAGKDSPSASHWIVPGTLRP